MKPWMYDLIESVIGFLGEAALWMLGAGFLHATYAYVPPIGFGTACVAAFFFGGASGERLHALRRIKELTGER